MYEVKSSWYSFSEVVLVPMVEIAGFVSRYRT